MAATEIKKESNTPGTVPAAEDEWDEARLQDGVERLRELHIQLRRLRDAIPSLVRPIHAESDSPETLYEEVHRAALGAANDVRQFRALLRDSGNREVLAHARASREQNGAGISSWLVEQHAHWLDEPAVRSARTLKIEDELNFPSPTGAENSNGASTGGGAPSRQAQPAVQDDIEAIVAAFKERYQEKGIEVKPLLVLHKIMFTLGPPKLMLTIEWDPAASERIYNVSTKGNSKMHECLKEGLARRANKDDLNWTMELLADYVNIKQERCHACNQLLDSNGWFAAVKVPKANPDREPGAAMQWDSFHVNCG